MTPSDGFSHDDKDKSHPGTVTKACDAEDPSLRQITSRAWQFTTRPSTLVTRAEKDDSIKRTPLDLSEQQRLNGHPLGRDFRLPFDYIRKQEGKPIARILTLVRPSEWSHRRGFYLATEYDPEKIPLIFIHGLLSTPVDFEALASSIASETDLWDRYQFWYYFYPTGDPWVLTAANFREDFHLLASALDPEKKHQPLQKETTVIAHSMGGLISRLSLSENSEVLYKKYFNHPLGDLGLSPAEKERVRQQFLFEPLAQPSKVIFLATPHKGALIARGPLLWIARSFVKTPARLVGSTLSSAQLLAFSKLACLTPRGASLFAGKEISVSGLRASDGAIEAMNEMPIRKDVELHNIIATVTGNHRGIGDWVVPYTSANLDQATSQTIVRSGHWLIREPETVEAVIKILR